MYGGKAGTYRTTLFIIHETVLVDGKNYIVNGLKANTRYVLLLRTYREIENEDGKHKLYQIFPSYVIVTTGTEHTPDEPTPTVPNLEKQAVTDVSVTVKWKYNSDFTYELVYSRLEDPNAAEGKWEFEISDDPESELEKYYDVAPNSYLKEFAGISYLTREFGDRKTDKGSLYLKNVNNITEEMQI